MIRCEVCEYALFTGTLKERQGWKPDDGYAMWDCKASVYEKGWVGCKKSSDGEEIPTYRRGKIIAEGMFLTRDTQQKVIDALEGEGWHNIETSKLGMPVIPEELWFVHE